LSLGSNLGDRMGYLRAVVGALERGPLLAVGGVSGVYEYGASAVELMRFCQGIEASLGRDRGAAAGEKAPRTVDVDVLIFGEAVIEGPHLVVPHPGVLRAFNLKGLADLAPGLYIPGRGAVGQLLAGSDLRGVRELEEGL
jgi:2-amino-4-hydroxy-6-hydroxymethyldihydropteridine diphosphokinase